MARPRTRTPWTATRRGRAPARAWPWRRGWPRWRSACRDRRVDRVPGQRVRRGGPQAHAGPGQPARDRAGLVGPGHRGSHDPDRHRGRGAARRDGRTGPRGPGDGGRGGPARWTTRLSWTRARWPGRGSACGGTYPGPHEAGDTIMVVLDQALDVLRHLGATVVDPVELPGAAGIEGPEWSSLLHEFKCDINGYLRALPGPAPRSLGELIDFNIHNGPSVLARFGQEIILQAEATSGDPADPAAQATRAEATARAREALDGPLASRRLDAIVTLTANPASLTDYVLGDNGVFHTSGPSAVAGDPALSVPAGQVSGLPGRAVVPRSRRGARAPGADRPGLRVRAGVAGARPGRPCGARPGLACGPPGRASAGSTAPSVQEADPPCRAMPCGRATHSTASGSGPTARLRPEATGKHLRAHAVAAINTSRVST